MKVNKIFDLSDSECAAVQTHNERELNQQLQFDDADMEMEDYALQPQSGRLSIDGLMYNFETMSSRRVCLICSFTHCHICNACTFLYCVTVFEAIHWQRANKILIQFLDLLYPGTNEAFPRGMIEFNNWQCSEIKFDEIVSDEADKHNEHDETDSLESSSSSMDTYLKPEADQTNLYADETISALNRNAYAAISAIDV